MAKILVQWMEMTKICHILLSVLDRQCSREAPVSYPTQLLHLRFAEAWSLVILGRIISLENLKRQWNS